MDCLLKLIPFFLLLFLGKFMATGNNRVQYREDNSPYIDIVKSSTDFKNWLQQENYKLEDIIFSSTSETADKITISFFHKDKSLVIISYTISKTDKKIINVSVEDLR